MRVRSLAAAWLTATSALAFAPAPACGDEVARGAFTLPTHPPPRADAPIPPPIVVPYPAVPTELAPSPLDPPLPPIIAPEPLPPPGHWTLRQTRRPHLYAGIIAAGAMWLGSAIAGIVLRDGWFALPVAGPAIGLATLHTYGIGQAAIAAAPLVAINVGMQGLFGPLFTALGLGRTWVWVPDP